MTRNSSINPGHGSGIILVSSCLVGLCTRYDGQSKPSRDCLAQLRGRTWIPVCPEQLGGLATPRAPADLIGGDGAAVLDGRATVVTRDGQDVTEAFVRGAQQCLAIARQQDITCAYLKADSPSCGSGAQPGVTAALLGRHNIRVREF